MIMNAPRKKLPTIPITSFTPVSAVAVPIDPKGPKPAFLQNMTKARAIIAIPRAYRIVLIFHLETIFVPITAPKTAATIIVTSVTESTSTLPIKTTASTTTGIQ